MAYKNLIDQLYGIVVSVRDRLAALESGGGGGPVSLDSFDNALTSDVKMPSTGTFYDGPAITLGAGKWLVVAHVQFVRSATTATRFVARIYDGTSAIASAEGSHPSQNPSAVNVACNAIVTLTSSTTLTLQGTTTSGATSCTMRAATPDSGSGNHATRICAVKIGP